MLDTSGLRGVSIGRMPEKKTRRSYLLLKSGRGRIFLLMISCTPAHIKQALPNGYLWRVDFQFGVFGQKRHDIGAEESDGILAEFRLERLIKTRQILLSGQKLVQGLNALTTTFTG